MSQGDSEPMGVEAMAKVLRGGHPDFPFTDFRHAYVTGLIAAELMDSDAFRVEIDSSKPVIGVRFGSHRYEILLRELQ